MYWVLLFRILASFSLLIAAVGSSGGRQRDQLNDFCRRWGHSSAVVDNKLYIDGGYVNWTPLAANPENRTNRQLLYHDLDKSYQGTPQLNTNLTKNLTENFVVGGTLWPDVVNKFLYSFAGEAASDRLPLTAGMSTYDILFNQWNKTEIPWHIRRLAWGASAVAHERGEGYYFGGWMTNRTSPGYQERRMMPGMVKFDMDRRKFTNFSGPDHLGRAEGAMAFLPLSDAGLLVYMGGLMDPLINGSVVGLSMSTIYLFNIATSEWYMQNATGEIPDMRRRFCTGASWATDLSSYNIYVYGGLGVGSNGVGFDDVYILSIPSFRWKKFWPTAPGGGRPRHSMTCNVVHKGQMLVIGGSFPDDDECDNPGAWGVHNLHLNGSSPEHKTQWDNFNHQITTYTVPIPLVNVIGGNPEGNAAITSPETRGSQELQILLSRRPSFGSRRPIRPVPDMQPDEDPHRRRLRILLGSVLGGTAFFTIIFAIAYYIGSERRKSRGPVDPLTYVVSPTTPIRESPKHELEAHEIMEAPNRPSPMKDPAHIGDGDTSYEFEYGVHDPISNVAYGQMGQTPRYSQGDDAYHRQLQRLQKLRTDSASHCRTCGSPTTIRNSF